MHDQITGTRVMWTDRGDTGFTKTGTVIRDDRRFAWTPWEPTKVAPDAGMVRVRWDGDQILHWEYVAELAAVTA